MKLVKRENKAKNNVKVGEFNDFLREHGAVEQFVCTLGAAIQEVKTFMCFTVYRKIVLLYRATAL